MSLSEGWNMMEQTLHNREVRRQAAIQRNQELQIQGYNVDKDGNIIGERPGSQAENQRLMNEETNQLLKATRAKLAAQETAGAIEEFSLTGNANNLQRALSDPYLKEVWASRGVHMVSNIDFENDVNMLSRAGLQDTAYDTPDKRAVLAKNMYKFYDGNEWQLGMVDKLAAETGTLNRLGERRSQPIIENKKQLVSLLSGPKVSPVTADGHKYEKEITDAANETGLPPNLIAAVSYQENRGREDVIRSKLKSPKGATGPMQLMPDTAKEVGVQDITNIAENYKGGAKYLKKMLDKYNGDLPLALAAYNAGPGNVDDHGGIPPFKETREYVNNILLSLDEAEGYYGGDSKSMSDGIASKYERIQDTILNDQAARVNASQGKTKDMIEAETKNTEAIRRQQDVQLQLQEDNLQLEREKNAIEREKLKLPEEKKGKAKDIQDARLIDEKWIGVNSKDLTPAKAAELTNDVIEFETYTGRRYDTKVEVDALVNIRKSINSAKKAKNLSFDDTGIFSVTNNTIGKYLFEGTNIPETEARVEFERIAAIYRVANAGLSQTSQEMENVRKVAGDLRENMPTVLVKLKGTLEALQIEIAARSDTMGHAQKLKYLGSSPEELDAIVQSLQRTLDVIEGKPVEGLSKEPTKDIGTPSAPTKEDLLEMFRK